MPISIEQRRAIQRRATAKYMSNPTNRAKAYARRKALYDRTRKASFEKYIDTIIELSADRNALIDYVMDNFNLKKRA